MIRVAIVDDHELVKDGFGAILQAEADRFQLIGDASNGLELFQLLQTAPTPPDVVLMDVNMPKMNGIEATQRLTEEFPAIKVIALTMIKKATHIKQMLAAGAVGYILKECGKDELFQALTSVMEGDTYFSKDVSLEIMNDISRLKRKSTIFVPELSKRELEVLQLIVQDLSNHEIAERLHISHRTVDSHKQNILSKTGTKSIAGLVVYAIKNQLVKMPE